MLQIETFTFNAFQENTYVIINELKDCWIIDPGMYDSSETNSFFSFIVENKLKPKAIINTHTHLDHIFGVQACKDEYNIPFLIHEKDLPVLSNAAGSAMLFGFDFKVIPVADSYIDEEKPLLIGEDKLVVRLVPGHSPGSVLFYYEPAGWVIGGDVLFNGSIGRTDLPGGSLDVLIQSIKTHVFTLPDETVVLSGHGPQTTIGHERQYNPFLHHI